MQMYMVHYCAEPQTNRSSQMTHSNNIYETAKMPIFIIFY